MIALDAFGAPHVAFWNLENLFDVDGSPDRPEWLQKALARELAGWNADVLATKVGSWLASSAR